MGLFFLAGVLSALVEVYALKWLEIIAKFLGGTSLVLIAISWIMPGIFILRGIPWIAHAWLRGINPLGVYSRPWEQLSTGGKVSVYIHSIIISAFMVIAVVAFIQFNF
jgi:hypothetical protein